ncbi:MAG TPA: hypothetical protein VHB30_00250 [Solirubrobacteraceae bacterium]|nr:hypothetical protein [Solirubrobacteraceae bacterium]
MLTWSEDLGKRVRPGDWADQCVSTVTKIEEAVADGRDEDAAQLVDYFMEEAKVCYRIYEVWMEGFVEWLGLQGVSAAERDAEVDRLKELLAFPDGRRFEPAPAWEALGAAAGALASRLRAQLGADGLDDLREDWRRLHDRYVDLISGILAFVARRFGENALEPCYRHVLEPYIAERYMPYDLRERSYESTLYRNLYTTFEAMRGHLCGPTRRGDMELVEDDDKWVVSFDPCGSGGRSSRGDPVEGTPPRPQAPYEFGVTTEAHDWAWNEKGVCHYCAHCCFALELLPAERWGHPVRVVDSPLYPAETSGDEPAKCTWTIYKRLDAIPEEAYRRIGRTKPASPARPEA